MSKFFDINRHLREAILSFLTHYESTRLKIYNKTLRRFSSNINRNLIKVLTFLSKVGIRLKIHTEIPTFDITSLFIYPQLRFPNIAIDDLSNAVACYIRCNADEMNCRSVQVEKGLLKDSNINLLEKVTGQLNKHDFEFVLDFNIDDIAEEKYREFCKSVGKVFLKNDTDTMEIDSLVAYGIQLRLRKLLVVDFCIKSQIEYYQNFPNNVDEIFVLCGLMESDMIYLLQLIKLNERSLKHISIGKDQFEFINEIDELVPNVSYSLCLEEDVDPIDLIKQIPEQILKTKVVDMYVHPGYYPSLIESIYFCSQLLSQTKTSSTENICYRWYAKCRTISQIFEFA